MKINSSRLELQYYSDAEPIEAITGFREVQRAGPAGLFIDSENHDRLIIALDTAGLARPAALDVTSDVYSLGAILYHTLTGRPPFVGQTIAETLKQVETSEPLAPCLLDPSLPLDLETICLKCLQKEPGARYASAQKLAEDLGRWLRHEPIVARPASPLLHLSRWIRRKPDRVASTAALLVASALTIGLIFVSEELVMLHKQVENLAPKNLQLQRDEFRFRLGSAEHFLFGFNKANAQLQHQLEGLWWSPHPSMAISSDQLADFVGRPKLNVPDDIKITPFRLGLFAGEYPVNDAHIFGLFLHSLQERMKRRLGPMARVDIRLYTDVTAGISDLCSGDVDLMCLGALPFLRARQINPRLQPMVQQVNATRRGAFFTRKDSGIRTLSDTKGKRIAFPGNTNSTISFNAQTKLAAAGVSATNVGDFEFIDGGLEATGDDKDPSFNLAPVYSRPIPIRPRIRMDWELEIRTARNPWIEPEYSDGKVILRVIDGTYDVGVATVGGFGQLPERIQLGEILMIPHSEFEIARDIWAAREGLSADVVQVFVEEMVARHHPHHPVDLANLPGRPTGFIPFDDTTHETERSTLLRIDSLFPPKPARIESLSLLRSRPSQRPSTNEIIRRR